MSLCKMFLSGAIFLSVNLRGMLCQVLQWYCYADCVMLSVVILSGIMLSVAMLIVAILSVVAL
jgi:hypothetical protein